MDLKDHIRSIPDFPKPGILFYDISTLLAHPGAWRHCVDRLAADVKPLAPDLLVGIESRGFLTAATLALELGCGFAMIRKKGKLPGATIGHTPTIWNTAATQSRFKPTRSLPANAWSSWTIYWPQVARRRRRWSSFAMSAAWSPAPASSSNSRSCRAAPSWMPCKYLRQRSPPMTTNLNTFLY